MKKNLIVLLLLALILTLSSCSNNVKHDISEYVLEMEYKEDFKILQLSDIHLANKDDRERQYEFLKETIIEANADLIVVSGDLFTFGDRRVAKELFNFFDSLKVHWTLTFGNHDEQCYFSIDWLTRYLNKLNNDEKSYCIFKDIQDDNITGNANFAINLMDGDTIKEQIILIDSNRYNYGEYIGYDYIKEDQINWYKDIINYTKEQNQGNLVESLLFFHIPIPEFDDAWESCKNGEPGNEYIMGEKREKCCSPDVNSGFFDVIKELNSSKAICVGHDHLNNYVVKYQGIYFSYCVNSTDRIYFDENVIGGTLITIKNNNELVFDQILRSYGEYK